MADEPRMTPEEQRSLDAYNLIVERELGDCRAQLETVTRERDEAREIVRSEQHPDCVVLLRAALPWLRESWNQELTARVAKLEAAGKGLASWVRVDATDRGPRSGIHNALEAWDAAVKPEQP